MPEIKAPAPIVKEGIMNRYRKFLVALAAVAVAGLVHVYGTNNQWVELVIGLAGALGVHQIPNA